MITLDTIVRGFGKVIGGAALGLSLYACSGEPAQPNPNENDTNSYDTKDTYNPKDLGYDSNDALDAYISKDENSLPETKDVLPEIKTDIPSIGDDGDDGIEYDDGLSFDGDAEFDADGSTDDGLDAIIDALEVEQDKDVPETWLDSDLLEEIKEDTPDVPVIDYKKVTINVENVVDGTKVNTNYIVLNANGKEVSSGLIKNGFAELQLENGTYTLRLVDNLTKATSFEYDTGKTLPLSGDFDIDFDALVEKMQTNGYSTEVINSAIAQFNKTVIGDMFDLETVITVDGDLVIKKQMIPNIDLDVPYLLNNGNINIENFYNFVLNMWGLQPLTSDGFVKPGQWITAPNAINVYIEHKTSLDGSLDYYEIAKEALLTKELKSGMQLYNLVDSSTDAHVIILFNPSAKASETNIDEIQFDPETGTPYLIKATAIIKPKNTYLELKKTLEHEGHHFNNGVGELNVIYTIGNNSSQETTLTEGLATAVAFRANQNFNSTEYLKK